MPQCGATGRPARSAVTLPRDNSIESPQPVWLGAEPGTIAKISPEDSSSCDHLDAKCCGCWGWLVADKSDAFGTGVYPFALSKVEVPNSDAAIKKSCRFLIKTQTENAR